VSPPATNLAVITRAGARASAAQEWGNAAVRVRSGTSAPEASSREEACGEEVEASRTNEAVPRLLMVAYLLAMIAMPLWLLAFLSVMRR
jgi:hypothetical protein